MFQAYGTLRRQQERSGELAKEAERLANLAEQILRQIATDYLTADRSAQVGQFAGQPSGSAAAIDAFVEAEKAWCDLLNGIDHLAIEWLNEGDPEKARQLVRLLGRCGEQERGEDLRREIEAKEIELREREEEDRALQAEWDANQEEQEAGWRRVDAISTSMSMNIGEVKRAIELLRSCVKDYPATSSSVALRFDDLHFSIWNAYQQSPGFSSSSQSSKEFEASRERLFKSIHGRYQIDAIEATTRLDDFAEVIERYF